MSKNKLNLQRILQLITYFLASIAIGGMIIGSINDTLSLITPTVSSITLIFIFLSWITLQYFAKSGKLKWVIAKKKTIKVKRINIKTNLIFVGFAVLFSIPLFVSLIKHEKSEEERIEDFNRAGPETLKLLIFPLKPDINCLEVDTDYRGQIIERLYDKIDLDSINLQILAVDSIPCPINSTQALEIGRKKKADMVIWGSYEETSSGSPRAIRLRYAMDTEYYIDKANLDNDTGMRPLESLSQLREGYLQEEIDYIVYWVQGMATHHSGDFNKSLVFFNSIITDSTEFKDFETLWRLSEVYRDLGSYEKAIIYADRALKASTINNSTDSSRAVIAYSYLSLCNYSLGLYDEALTNIKLAYAIRNSMSENNTEEAAKTLNILAGIYSAKNDLNSALDYAKKSVTIYQELDTFDRKGLANSHNSLASIYRDLGEMDLALNEQLTAVKIIEEELGKEHPKYANFINTLGIIHQNRGDFKTAASLLEQALVIRETYLNSSHPDIANSYNNLALLYGELAQPKKALEMQEKYLSSTLEIYGPCNPKSGTAYNNLAIAYYNNSRLADAINAEEDAIIAWEEDPENNQNSLLTARSNLSSFYYMNGDIKESIGQMKVIINHQVTQLGISHPNLANSYNNLAVMLKANEEYSEAIVYLDKAIEILIVNPDANKSGLATAYHNLADNKVLIKDYEGALVNEKACITLLKKMHEPDHPSIANAYNTFAMIYRGQGKYPRALKYQKDAIRIWTKHEPNYNTNISFAQFNLSLIYTDQKKYDLALSILNDLKDNFSTMINPDSNFLEKIKDKIKEVRSLIEERTDI